jgi:hypothetical protein
MLNFRNAYSPPLADTKVLSPLLAKPKPTINPIKSQKKSRSLLTVITNDISILHYLEGSHFHHGPMIPIFLGPIGPLPTTEVS